MKRKASPNRRAPDVVYTTHDLTQANFDLLTKLIHWLVDIQQREEKRQTRYRAAMVQLLARIESTVSMILVGQQVRMQTTKPFFYGDKLEADAKKAEELISRQSQEAGLKMIRFIYGEDKAPESEPRHDRRRKWSGWEI